MNGDEIPSDQWWPRWSAPVVALVGAALIGWLCGSWMAAGGTLLTAILASGLVRRERQSGSGTGARIPDASATRFAARAAIGDAVMPPWPAGHPVPPLADVLDAIGDPVMIVAGGRIVIANRAARQSLGEFIPGEDVRMVLRHPGATELLSRDAPQSSAMMTGLIRRANRSEMRVTTIARGVRLVRLVDQTDAYALERARVDFVANASHELRTPLAAILGFIETLEEGGAGDDPKLRQRFLGVMMREARRMQQLVEDLLSLSRIEADKYRSPEERLDFGALMTSVVAEVNDACATAPGQPPRIVASAAECPPIIGDRAQLSQLLHNLIENALKYGAPDRSVEVTMACMGASGEAGVKLTVRDYGDGIAAEHLPRLTERFFRVDAGRSRGLGGTGLGLAIVKHIVERHRGRLNITSVVGSGTTVTVFFPGAPVADA